METRVNTERVQTAATEISNLNIRIHNEFTPVQSAMTSLLNAWEGKAAVKASNIFNTIKSQYLEERFQVMRQYTEFMRQQVGIGYENTESVNKTLAEHFK